MTNNITTTPSSSAEYAVVGDNVREMFSSIARRYDLTNSFLSFGIHHLWRWRLLRRVPLKPGLRALDLCTGTGDLFLALQRRKIDAIGSDFCLPMLKEAQKKSGKPSARLVQGDALSLPFPSESLDLVTVAFGVRNFENLERGLKEIHRVLHPGGKALILEFGQPRGIIWGGLFRWYSKFVMPILGGLLTRNWYAYRYLPATAANFPCGHEFSNRLNHCGFSSVEVVSLSGGVAYLYDAIRSQ